MFVLKATTILLQLVSEKVSQNLVCGASREGILPDDDFNLMEFSEDFNDAMNDTNSTDNFTAFIVHENLEKITNMNGNNDLTFLGFKDKKSGYVLDVQSFIAILSDYVSCGL